MVQIPNALYPVSAAVNLSDFHCTFVTTKGPCRYISIDSTPPFVLDLTSFYPMLFFCSRISSKIPPYFELSCFLMPLWAVTMSRIFSDFGRPRWFWGVLMRYFLVCPSIWDRPMFFSCLDWAELYVKMECVSQLFTLSEGRKEGEIHPLGNNIGPGTEMAITTKWPPNMLCMWYISISSSVFISVSIHFCLDLYIHTHMHMYVCLCA